MARTKTQQAGQVLELVRNQPKRVTIAIDAIRMDGGTQMRANIDRDVVEEYARDIRKGDVLPPPTVFFDGENYWLADGYQRVDAHKVLGRAEIECDVRQGTKRDAILFSVGANAAHGLRRTREDKRRAVLTLLNNSEVAINLETGQPWSDNQIARLFKVSPHTVAALRPDVTMQTHSEPRAYVTKHGTVATMNTGAIGKKPAQPEPQHDDEPPLFPEVAPSPLPSPAPHESKAGVENRAMDPRALWVWGRLLDFKRDGILTADPAAIEAEMLNHMRDTVRELGPKVIDWLKRLVVAL